MSWNKLYRPIAHGGLGIRKINHDNKALFMNRIWNIHDKPQSICTKLYREKYLKQQPIFQTTIQIPTTSSPQWKQMTSLVPFVKKNIFHRVGNGLNTPIQAN